MLQIRIKAVLCPKFGHSFIFAQKPRCTEKIIKTTGKAGGMLAAESRCQWQGLEPTDTSDICKFAPQPQMRRGSFASLVQREGIVSL